MQLTSQKNCDAIKLILEKVNYELHKWRLCCDLKVVAFLTGMQGGYVKYGCFLCKWDSRWPGNHYARKDWEMRSERRIGKYNILFPPHVPSEKILLPPLHIKLGLVKNFIKRLDTNIGALDYLRHLFPKLSEAKT